MKCRNSHLNNNDCYVYSTTSTLSVGSTGSQARLIQSSHAPSHYQPVLMKDLGKTSSTDSTESVSFHTEKSSDSTSGVDVNDDVCQLTDEIVDKHLADLKQKCLSNETRDVAKFMEKLKNQSESVDETSDMTTLLMKADGSGGIESGKKMRRESESKKELETVPKVKSGEEAKEKENHLQVKSTQQKKSSLSPQGSMKKPKTIDLDSYQTSSSTTENQVHIVKIKSPKLSRENSRNSSMERSPSRERQNSLKKPEGGILKKPSPKFGKHTFTSNSLRPDSFISPFSSFESKSDKMSPSSEILPNDFVRESKQRASFSDYERGMKDYQKNHQQQAMKSRSLESSLELLKPAIKHQSSYENTSPFHHYDPMRYCSLSAQHSIESNRSPIRYYSPVSQSQYYEPFYEYPRHHRGVKSRRESRSLERPQVSRQSSSEFERYYDDPPYNRRHSFYEHRSIPHQYYSTSPDDFLMSHYEQPSACVDCYYQSYRGNLYQQQHPPPLPQRNPSQQKSPSATMKRQSRSRKKLSRRMSSNYFNKSFDDDGISMQQSSAAVVGKQSNDNEEIRV
jgi:hypothetical protein